MSIKVGSISRLSSIHHRRVTAGFSLEDARIAHLFGPYDRIVQPLTAADKKAQSAKGRPPAK